MTRHSRRYPSLPRLCLFFVLTTELVADLAPHSGPPQGRRPHDVWCGTLGTGQIQEQDRPPGFTRGALELAMEPSLGPRGPAPSVVPFLDRRLICPRNLAVTAAPPQGLDHSPERPECLTKPDQLSPGRPPVRPDRFPKHMGYSAKTNAGHRKHPSMSLALLTTLWDN